MSIFNTRYVLVSQVVLHGARGLFVSQLTQQINFSPMRTVRVPAYAASSAPFGIYKSAYKTDDWKSQARSFSVHPLMAIVTAVNFPGPSFAIRT